MLEELPEVQDRRESQEQRFKSALREIVDTALLMLLIFIVVRVAVHTFRIEGVSMEPNLHDGQYLIVNKLVY